MEILDCNLDFLDNIEIDSVSKSLRFNEKEAYMIKFPIYLKKPFGTYVKELINNDIKQYCAKNQKIAQYETAINKESLKDIIREILQENDSIVSSKVSESKNIEEELAVDQENTNEEEAENILLEMLRG